MFSSKKNYTLTNNYSFWSLVISAQSSNSIILIIRLYTKKHINHNKAIKPSINE